MQFGDIYSEALSFWPAYIDINQFIGGRIPCLEDIYNPIDNRYPDDLIRANLHWAIFTAVHKAARAGQRIYLDENIRADVIEKFLSSITHFLSDTDQTLSADERTEMQALRNELTLLLAEKSPGAEPGL